MKKYPKYKPSNIDWIGDIPEHWDVKRLKYVANANPSNIDKKSKEDEDTVFLCNYVDVYKNDFITDEIEFMKATASRAQIEKFTLKKGDIIATKDSESANDIGIAALVKQDFENVVCGYHLTYIKPEKLVGEYLFRQFQSEYIKRKFETLANGVTRYALGVDAFNCLNLVLPPESEQIEIANYLDKKTQEIDQLIEDKKQLLKLITEEKAAIINQIITKGLIENQNFIDSKMEFIGEIPDNWSIKKIKHIVSKVGSGVTPSGGAEVYELNGIPLLRSQNIHFDGLRLDDVAYINEDTHNNMKNSKVLSGDVLLNITGASIGRCFYVDENLGEANVNQHVSILRPNEKVLTKYLYYNLYSNIGQQQIRKEQTGSGREGLNFEVLKNFQVPIPEIPEQVTIVDYIDSECNEIDFRIKKTKKLIDLLIEYRSALISEVVTGKVKVID